MKKRQRGNTILEFALVCAFLVPLFAATADTGMLLTKSIQVTSVSRDSVVLLLRAITDPSSGLDLSKPANQALIVRTAAGLGMNQSGGYTPDPNGKAVVILSKVILVGANECSAGIIPAPNGAPPWNASNCPNYNQYVFAYRIVIGNGTRFTSSFGNPPSAIIQSDGTISAADIATNTSDSRFKFRLRRRHDPESEHFYAARGDLRGRQRRGPVSSHERAGPL